MTSANYSVFFVELSKVIITEIRTYLSPHCSSSSSSSSACVAPQESYKAERVKEKVGGKEQKRKESKERSISEYSA